MQENEFEKQVRHRLEQLDFQPSEEVWRKVEQEIRPRKKRRILLWIPAAAAMMVLSFGAWWWLDGNGKTVSGENTGITENGRKEQGQQDKSVIAPGNNSGDINPGIAGEKIATLPENEKQLAATQKTGNESTSVPLKDVVGSGTAGKGENNQQADLINSADKGIKAGEKVSAKAEPSISQMLETMMPNGAIVHNKPAAINKGKQIQHAPGKNEKENFNKKKQTEVALLQHSKVNADALIITQKSVEKKLSLDKEKQPSLSLANQSLLEGKFVCLVAPSSVKRSKWIYGITASAGASWPVYNGAAAEKNIMTDNTFAGSVGLAPIMRPTLVAPMAPVGVRAAAEPGAAFSFTAGVYAGREWKGKFGLKTGVQYSQLNTEYKVGDYVNYTGQVNLAGINAPLRSYYQNGTTSNYTSNYHFLEMPLEGSYTLNSRAKLPVSFTAGGTVSYLLATDGLHYDKINGIYYEDMDLYNRTQVAVQAGVSVKLLQRKAQSLSAGPVFKYHLTANRDKEMFQRENLTYVGMRIFMGLR